MNFRARTLVALSLVVSASSQVAFSQEATSALRPLESYQIESQYGPEVAVLNPIFPKDEKIELTLGANYSPVSSLYDYFGASAGVIYHLNRRHAIEPIWAQYNFGSLSNFAKTQIQDKVTSPTKRAELGVDVPRMILSSSYIYTPYYSKMHLTDMSVLHMDFFLSAGLAGLQTEQFLLNDQKGNSTWRLGAALGAGVKLLMRSRWAFRLELRDFIHPAKNIGANEITNDLQVTAGMSIFLGAFPDYTSL